MFFQPIYCEKLLRRKFKMSKKLLNEAAVRRFMGLAGMQANMVSNTVNEMYGAKDDEEKEMAETVEATTETVTEEEVNEAAHEEKEEGEYMEEDMNAMEGEHEDPVEDEMMADAPEMELTSAEAEVLVGVLEKLTASLDKAAVAEPEMDMDAEEEMELADDDAVEDEEDAMAMMEEKEEEMNEDEIVQEVARRVAARILKAKKAQKEMNEALGK